MSTHIDSKQWHQPNAYEKERMTYTEKHQNVKRPRPKIIIPDPTTVEAELQLEEHLWQS